ncbi:CCR4-Not complex component [Seiridium cupressi]
MLFKTSTLLLALSPGSLAWEWGKAGKWTGTQRMNCRGGDSYINYTTVTGFFQQDDSATDASTFDYTTANYGLINRTYETDAEFDPHGTKTQWQRFEYYVNTLNQEADHKTQFKVVYFARHGEGYHNAAETFYGTPAWNCYWGEQDGNATVTWADAYLTAAGIAQTTKANTFWKSQLANEKMPAPRSYYTSPLNRCTITANLTFNGLDLPAEYPFVPTVKELFREGISIHTCDRRSTKSHIESLLPFYKVEHGFTEYDELWNGTYAETSDAQAVRSKKVLDDVFSNDENTWISVTSHSGEIKSLLSVLGHRTFSLSTGQAIPVLVEARNLRKVDAPTSTVSSWSLDPTYRSTDQPDPRFFTCRSCSVSASLHLHHLITINADGNHRDLVSYLPPPSLIGLIGDARMTPETAHPRSLRIHARFALTETSACTFAQFQSTASCQSANPPSRIALLPPPCRVLDITPMVPPPPPTSRIHSGSGTFSPILQPAPALQTSGLSSAASPITGSPTGGHRFDTSITITQIYVLLNLLRDNTRDRAKWELQANQLQKLIHDHGMEVFPRYFARLVAQNAGTIFQGSGRPPPNSGDYSLLTAEIDKISHDPEQAGKIAESIETGTDNVFRNFDLSTFMEHFKLDALEKTILALAFKFGSDANLKTKADAILSTNFPTFMNIIARPDYGSHGDLDSQFIAAIVDRYVQGHPPNFNSSAKQELAHKVQARWSPSLSERPAPLEVLASLDLMRLLGDKPTNALTRYIQRVGADFTRGEDSCYSSLENRPENIDLSAEQVSSALLYTTISQTPRYDPSVLVAGLRRVLPPSFAWQDVLAYFDHRDVRVSSEQFLRLYQALLPIAQTQSQANSIGSFDIQYLWGGSHWENPETQLAFICLQTTFAIDEYDQSPQAVRERAAEAVKHPLVSVAAMSAIFQVALHSLHASQSSEAKRLFQGVVIPNLDVFLVSAFGVPKPWPNMAMDTMGSLFTEFLHKKDPLSAFVMDSLWRKDKSWVRQRLFEAHATVPLDLPLIFAHAVEHSWLGDLVYLANGFGYDLAALAHAEGYLDLQDWSSNIRQSGNIANSLLQFLSIKAGMELRFQRHESRSSQKESWPLQVKTVSAMLQILEDLMPRKPLPELVMVQRQCIISYPRLINYGEGCDDIINANGTTGNALAPQAVARMEEHFKTMYSSDIQVKDIVDTLLRYKHSRDPLDQDVFACMIHGLFDEYSHFPDYPLEALATTAVLFGGIISRKLISELPLKVGLGMILEAVRDHSPDESMYKFGLQALMQLFNRFKDWPGFCEELVQISGLQGTEAWKKAVEVKSKADEDAGQDQNGGTSASLNGSENKVNGTGNGSESSSPPFASVHADDPPGNAHFETPNERIQDTIQFGLNNLTAAKLQGVFADIQQHLEHRYQQWFASHLVEERAKMQPNYHQVYLDFVRLFQDMSLSAEVLRQTYISVTRMINSESTLQNSTERTHLKNLGAWLGLLTIARDQPIKHRNIAFKQLLVEAYDTKRLIVVIPFVCKVLIQGVRSTVYRPPNPWLMDILHLLIELYHNGDLKLNLKFEIEVLCKDLNLDHKSIEPSQELSQHRAQIDEIADLTTADTLEPFENLSINGVSGAPGLSPHPVQVSIPDLTAQLSIPPNNEMVVSAARLLDIVRQALTRALHDIITPVVDRSVTIAAISTQQMIHKDFATELDEKRIRDSAITMVKATAGSLALVTSKEPLRANITNYMRQLSSELQQPLPEGTIIMCVTSNLDLACSVIEKHAEERAVPEIEEMIEQELEARRRHRHQRPNDPYVDQGLSRWAMTIPNPYKLSPNMNGLNQEQLAIYEEFGRQSRPLAPATQAHTASASDATRSIANEVLQDQYSSVPNLPTPAETPSMPLMPAQVPYAHVQPSAMTNGRPVGAPITQVDARALAERVQKLLSELQRAAAEAREDHFTDLPRNHPVMEAVDALTQLIIRTSQTSDEFAVYAAEKITQTLFSQIDHKSLILESLVHVLESLLKIYGGSGTGLLDRVQALVDHQPLQNFLNISLVTALLSTDLLNLQVVDEAAKAALNSRQENALEFFERLWDLTLGSDKPVALYGDFIGSLPQAWHWINAEPDLEISQRLKAKILSSGVLPPGHLARSAQLEQFEYLFEEWLRQYYNHNTPDKAAISFARQLLEKGVITSKDDLTSLLRRALELAINYHEQSTLVGVAGHESFNALDALANLVSVLAQVNIMQLNDAARGAVVVFDAVFMLGALVLNHHHTQRGEHFNARAFFRFFAMLICEANRVFDQFAASGAISPVDAEAYRQELLFRLSDTFSQIVPERFPGFAFHWLELIQHRLFMPELLISEPGRGWAQFTKLVVALLRNVSEHLKVTDMHDAAKEYVRAATKFMIVLQHDYPDYLAANHVQLCAHLLPHATQFRNIILSATPRGEGAELNLSHYNLAEVYLQESGLLDLVDQLLHHGPSEDAIAHLTHAINRTDARPTIFGNVPITTNTALVSAVVLYIGTFAVRRAKEDGDLFNPRSPDAATLSLLAHELNPESRYFFLSSVVDELRFTGPHSSYYSKLLFELWGQDVNDPEELDIRQQIARILLERFSGFWPQPWSLVYVTLDLLRNEKYMFFDQPFIKADREVRDRFQGIFRSIDNMP